MPSTDLSESEWLELYRHLLAGLQTRDFDDVRMSIEAAAFAPVFEGMSAEDDERIAEIVRGEVGKRVLRRRSASEVFAAASGVLRSRLIELPTIAHAIANRFACSPHSVEFRVDYEEQYAPTKSEPIGLARLVVSSEETEALKGQLNKLGIEVPHRRPEQNGYTQ